MSKLLNVRTLSSASCRLSFMMRRSISTSETRKNRCRLSITIFCSRMNGKIGRLLTLNFFLLLADVDNVKFSSVVLAPFVESVSDHFFCTSCRSFDEHLHQIHEYCDVALSIPIFYRQ